MVVIHKLTRNGNSTMMSIPLGFIRALGWSCGEQIALELAEDGTIWVRRPTLRDLRASNRRPMVAAPVEAGR